MKKTRERKKTYLGDEIRGGDHARDSGEQYQGQLPAIDYAEGTVADAW